MDATNVLYALVGREKETFQAASETLRGASKIPEIIWQRVPDCYASNSKSPAAKCGVSLACYDHLVTTGWS